MLKLTHPNPNTQPNPRTLSPDVEEVVVVKAEVVGVEIVAAFKMGIMLRALLGLGALLQG